MCKYCSGAGVKAGGDPTIPEDVCDYCGGLGVR